MIYAEKRWPDLDYELEMAWERLGVFGTANVNRPILDKRIIGLNLKDERLNFARLQVAGPQ